MFFKAEGAIMKFINLSSFLCLVVLALILTFPTLAQAAYSFTTIDVPGASLTRAFGISNGQIVGGFQDTKLHGFVLNGETFTTIDQGPTSFMELYGTNGPQMVGYYNPGGGTFAIMVTGGTVQAIPVTGANAAWGINSDGTMVGSYTGGGFALGSDGFLNIGSPGTTAFGINNFDQIVGSQQEQGFFLSDRSGSGTFILFDFPGASKTEAHDVNNSDQIVGSYRDVNNVWHGFLLEGFIGGAGSYTTIDFPGASRTDAHGISDAGHIVGVYEDESGQHGFLAMPNQPPVADAGEDQEVECTSANSAMASLDGTGSSDPDSDPLTFTWTNSFGTVNGSTPTVSLPLGTSTVDLEVDDGNGETDTDFLLVEVEDTIAPVVQCNTPDTIAKKDVPISFTATATDACSVPIVMVTDFDCFKFTKKGKRVDRTKSCQISFGGDTINILNSGGVGTHISWTVTASDGNGNQTSATCEVIVEKPGKP